MRQAPASPITTGIVGQACVTTLKDFELAQQRFEALPESKQSGLSSEHMRANLLRKKAMAMRELGEYSQAVPLFDQALIIQKQIAAADPKDTRSLFDVYVDLSQAAYDYEESADPAFTTDPIIRRRQNGLGRSPFETG